MSFSPTPDPNSDLSKTCVNRSCSSNRERSLTPRALRHDRPASDPLASDKGNLDPPPAIDSTCSLPTRQGGPSKCPQSAYLLTALPVSLSAHFPSPAEQGVTLLTTLLGFSRRALAPKCLFQLRVRTGEPLGLTPLPKLAQRPRSSRSSSSRSCPHPRPVWKLVSELPSSPRTDLVRQTLGPAEWPRAVAPQPRPRRQPALTLPELGVVQHVVGRVVADAVQPQDLHHGVAEAALGLLRRPLQEDHHPVLLHQRVQVLRRAAAARARRPHARAPQAAARAAPPAEQSRRRPAQGPAHPRTLAGVLDGQGPGLASRSLPGARPAEARPAPRRPSLDRLRTALRDWRNLALNCWISPIMLLVPPRQVGGGPYA